MPVQKVSAALLAIATNGPAANTLTRVRRASSIPGAFCVRVRGALETEASIGIALGKVNDPAPPAAGRGRAGAFP